MSAHKTTENDYKRAIAKTSQLTDFNVKDDCQVDGEST